jgi:hypothetical protein
VNDVDDRLDHATAGLVLLCHKAFESDDDESKEYAASVLSICAVTLRHKFTRIPETSVTAVEYLKSRFG